MKLLGDKDCNSDVKIKVTVYNMDTQYQAPDQDVGSTERKSGYLLYPASFHCLVI